VCLKAWNVTSGNPMLAANFPHSLLHAIVERGALEAGEEQNIIRHLTGAEHHTQFKLRLAVLPQGIHQNIGQGDVSAPSL
jgi:hypothetical protein